MTADIVAGGNRHRPQCRDCASRWALPATTASLSTTARGPPIRAVFAAGDCTRHVGRDGQPVRLESVQNAIDQAKHASLAMLGRPVPYREVPWFWSDQYDLKLQIAGLAREGDELVLRGEPESRKFAVFHLRDGSRCCGRGGQCRARIYRGPKVDCRWDASCAASRLADTSIAMKSVVST